ncbi:hypothetical protein OU757_004520 [Yersinia enterocolitica]|uniref:hypothetical protein n=1 Tax=Yersinia enterocolitica TaxID=630 RepID=UPI0028F4FAE4|nr:hypothetical protein [Yersinia enterocolitica]EKN3588962.1 hypothetical protein [Yersinia enterocolitica]EKN3769417.1 hypothetical protein [Yersinia enterocolitica]EKN4084542.1 hypothetical protein [Yersinia enterocolitica]EKN6170567.1 hypothetical protein [Yersinia enterocolitica]
MSSLSEWIQTAQATIWSLLSMDEYGKRIYSAPVVIACDYGGTSKVAANAVGQEFVIKNTFWTEYSDAKKGDMICIGASSELTPPNDADEIRQIIRDADSFERLKDDYTLITGV